MQCSNCQTENPEVARFCMNCGQPMQQHCPNCGTENPPQARFCFNCGTPFPSSTVPSPPSSTAPPPPSSTLHRYIPPELLAKLEAARSRRGLAGERRVVTMLFCDVTGSTAAAETLDPEEWTEIINGAFEQMVRPVYKYEGTVARLMGDGILAFFGAPIAHEDDPLRAALAGLEIAERIKTYCETVQARWQIPLAVRVGINTGLVVVGEVGSDLRLEYTATGDAINLAARMEQTAAPGTVQISEETYRRIAPYVEVEAVGPIQVKGKQAPVQAYRVLRAREVAALERGSQEELTPVTGRDAELDSLDRAVAELRHGVGRVVTLLGEAGLGKSRLLRELRRRTDAELGSTPVRWLTVGTYSFAAQQPYSLCREIVRRAAGIGQNDEPTEVVSRLGELAKALAGADHEETLLLLQTLFAVDADQPGAEIQAEGELFKSKLFALTELFLRYLAAEQPLLLAMDDMQWADPASVELLRHVAPLVEELPILFLCAFRPDRDAPIWEYAVALEKEMPHRYREVRLAPLSPAEGSRLAASVIGIADLPAPIARQIMDLSEGNPFFIEEVVHELVEQGVVVRDENGVRWEADSQLAVGLPDNLQALLLARLDRLEDSERHTLQLASVIGRRFYYRVLEAISEREERLDQALGALQRQALIREEARIPEREYAFRHALTQEAAYRNILRRQRVRFHQQVGEALEELYPARREEMAPLLAHHFARAGDERALDYYILAGKRAARLHANVEAAGHYRRALQLAREREDFPPERLAGLYRAHGRALEHTGHFADAEATYVELERIGRERDEDALVLAALMEQTKLRATATDLYDTDRGQELLEQVLALAEKLEDRASEARAYWLKLNLHRLVSEADEAQEAGERAVALSRELVAQPGAGNAEKTLLAYALHDLALLQSQALDMVSGTQRMNEARELWEEVDNKAMLADNLASSVLFLMSQGQFKQAVKRSGEAYELSKNIHNLWNQSYSRMIVGVAHRAQGHPALAIEASEESIRAGEQAGFAVARVYSLPIIASVLSDFGDHSRAAAMLEQLKDDFPNVFTELAPAVDLVLAHIYLEAGDVKQARGRAAVVEKVMEGRWWLLNMDVWRGGTLFAELALAEHDPEAALDRLEQRQRAGEGTGMTFFQPNVAYLQAKALYALGRSDEARRLLLDSRARMEAQDARHFLWPALVLLADIEEEAGNLEDANAMRAEAARLVTYIADHAPPEHKESFLSRRDVAALLAS